MRLSDQTFPLNQSTDNAHAVLWNFYWFSGNQPWFYVKSQRFNLCPATNAGASDHDHHAARDARPHDGLSLRVHGLRSTHGERAESTAGGVMAERARLVEVEMDLLWWGMFSV